MSPPRRVIVPRKAGVSPHPKPEDGPFRVVYPEALPLADPKQKHPFLFLVETWKAVQLSHFLHFLRMAYGKFRCELSKHDIEITCFQPCLYWRQH
jgi:hypothetical protein